MNSTVFLCLSPYYPVQIVSNVQVPLIYLAQDFFFLYFDEYLNDRNSRPQDPFSQW